MVAYSKKAFWLHNFATKTPVNRFKVAHDSFSFPNISKNDREERKVITNIFPFMSVLKYGGEGVFLILVEKAQVKRN